MDESINRSVSEELSSSDEVMNVSNFGDEELGIFWGQITEKEEEYVQQLNYMSNKSTTDSCHQLYDLEEVDEEEEQFIDESNDSMALSQNESQNNVMNETFTIGAELTIDCDECRNEEESEVMPVWNDCDVSHMSVDQSFTQSFSNIDINVCHNEDDIHSYSNAINIPNNETINDKPIQHLVDESLVYSQNNETFNDKPIQHLIDESLVNSDPFSPTFFNTFKFKRGENIEKRNSSLGLINTENIMINTSPEINAEEVVNDLDNFAVINDFEPNDYLFSKPKTPSMPSKLFENSNDIEVNAKDLLSPFGCNQFRDDLRSHSSQADKVVNDLDNIQVIKDFESNDYLFTKPMTPSMPTKLFENSDEIEVNAMDLLSPFGCNQSKDDLRSHSSQADEVAVTCSLVDITLPQNLRNFNMRKKLNLAEMTPQKKNFNINDSTLDFILNEMACNSPEKINESFKSEELITDTQTFDFNLINNEILEVEDNNAEELDISEKDSENFEEVVEVEKVNEEKHENNEKLSQTLDESLKITEKFEGIVEIEKVNEEKHEMNEKLNQTLDESVKVIENKTPKILKTGNNNITLRSSKKKVTFMRSPLANISANIESDKSSTNEKYSKTKSDNNSELKKPQNSGIKPPQKLRQTPNTVTAKKCIDFSDQTEKASGIKRPQKRSPIRTPITSTGNKKAVHFDNVVSPVAHYIKHMPTPPIQRNIKPKTIPAATFRLGLPQPGFLSRIKTGTDEEMRKRTKISQLPTLVYRSTGTPKLNKPLKDTKTVIPLIAKHIGGNASHRKPEYMDASNNCLNDVTASTSFHEIHNAKHTSFLKH